MILNLNLIDARPVAVLRLPQEHPLSLSVTLNLTMNRYCVDRRKRLYCAQWIPRLDLRGKHRLRLNLFQRRNSYQMICSSGINIGNVANSLVSLCDYKELVRRYRSKASILYLAAVYSPICNNQRPSPTTDRSTIHDLSSTYLRPIFDLSSAYLPACLMS